MRKPVKIIFKNLRDKSLPTRTVIGFNEKIKTATHNWYHVNMNYELDIKLSISGTKQDFDDKFTHVTVDGKTYRITSFEQTSQNKLTLEGEGANTR